MGESGVVHGERPTASDASPHVTVIGDWGAAWSSMRGDDPTELVVLAFIGSWSEPWNEMEPILNEVASEVVPEYKVKVCTLDVTKFELLARRLKVRVIPTLVLLKNQRVKKRVVGVKNKEGLKNDIVSRAEKK